MRVGSGTGDSNLTWLAADHLNSTSLMIRASDHTITAKVGYYPWGQTRYNTYDSESDDPTTDRLYTGQREEAALGLYYYNARWYDPALSHFIMADTIIPGAGNPQAWDRYAYTLNNPIRYNDPSGHAQACADGDIGGGCGSDGTNNYIISRIQRKNHVVINNDNNLWNTKSLLATERGIIALKNSMGEERFQETFSGTRFSIYTSSDPNDINRVRMVAIGKDDVKIGDLKRNDENSVSRNTVHELAHIWDARCNYCKSETMMTITGSKYDVNGKYYPSGQMSSDYPSADTPNGALEDWAESVTNVVLPNPVHDPWDFRRQDYVKQNLDPNYYGGLH